MDNEIDSAEHAEQRRRPQSSTQEEAADGQENDSSKTNFITSWIKSSKEKEPDRFNVQSFAVSKTAAIAMTNLSLFSRNCSTVRDLLLEGMAADFFYWLMTLLVTSLILQTVAGALLFLSLRKNMNDDEEKEEEHKLTKGGALLAFAIVIINVTISAFIGVDVKLKSDSG
ncbi:ninjurin-2-like [Ptychodera flava]|uniref:ninjurin-2-like n=1 Tax=Ptychodera flava TaxID=63121 RepID=UPI00396AAA56